MIVAEMHCVEPIVTFPVKDGEPTDQNYIEQEDTAAADQDNLPPGHARALVCVTLEPDVEIDLENVDGEVRPGNGIG